MRRTAEDYLKYIYLIQKQNGIVRGVDLAEQLGVSKPTVSIKLKNLVSEGYVAINSEHEISLTDKGRDIAVSIAEKNLACRELLEKLGVDKEIAARDACRMEHAIGPESYEALKKLSD